MKKTNVLRKLSAAALALSLSLSAAPAFAADVTYTFTPSEVNLGSQATVDKADIPEGTAFAGGYIRVAGRVTQRFDEAKGGIYCIELDKDQKGGLEFTVTGSANVTVSASSTGGANSSTVGIINTADGSVVANPVTIVTGTVASTLTYSDLGAGTYQVVSTITDDDNLNRGVRILGVTITERAAAHTEETPTVTGEDNGSAAPVNTAYPSTQSVLVDGSPVEFQCYALKDENGNDTNYIKLRDLAAILSGTAARFEVGWDGSVTITTGAAYTSNGSEGSTPFSGERAYEVSAAQTLVNGSPAALEAIVLTDDQGGGYNYYKLRDLGDALGFLVDWSAEKGIFIETSR